MRNLWTTRVRTLAGAFLLVALALTFTAAAPRPSGQKNVGCSREDNLDGSSTRPSSLGCITGGGGCYDCLYSGAGGYTECFENPDGTISICIDFQNV